MINEWPGCEIIGTYAIETQELTKRFVLDRGFLDVIRNTGKRDVLTTLDGVNIRVREGEVLGLLGPNGAGKSTLIKILCTLILPSEGNAYVNGYDVVKEGQKARSSLGFVTTDERSFYWRLSGRENLQFFATLHNLPQTQVKARVEELLDVVNLKHRADEPFLNYSAGMKQRLKLAQALVHDPKLIFLDEPTTNLDPHGRREILELIKDISSSKDIQVLISSHILTDIETICSQVVILNKGKIAAQGDLKDLRSIDYSLYELKVQGDGPGFRKKLEGLDCRVEETDDGLIKVFMPSGRDRMEIFRAAAESGVQVRHFVKSRTSLEDLFAKTVGVD